MLFGNIGVVIIVKMKVINAAWIANTRVAAAKALFISLDFKFSSLTTTLFKALYAIAYVSSVTLNSDLALSCLIRLSYYFSAILASSSFSSSVLFKAISSWFVSLRLSTSFSLDSSIFSLLYSL